jgi:hypothetical protein
MTRIILDDALSGTLSAITGPVELCDGSGRVLGRFFPALDPEFYDLEPNISKAELERRRKNKGKMYTTAEVLAYL